MSNFLDYLDWRGDLSFDRDPFNEVDNLIFSEIAYADLRGIVPAPGEEGSVTLREAAERYESEGRDQSYLVNDPKELLRRAGQSERFGTVRLSACADDTDAQAQLQFAALTAELADGSVFVAYRGTDNSLVGWREDFNLGVLDETPGQRLAAAYLDETAARHTGPLRIGGHSKGGNLALYAAVFCGDETKARLLAAYSNDGPGFRRDLAEQPRYREMIPRLHKLLPTGSIIGLLLSDGEERTIVRSSGEGAMQHDPYTWQVRGRGFERAEKLSAKSQLLEETLDRWVDELDDSERENLVTAIFDSLDASEAKTFAELNANKRLSYGAVLRALRGLDPALQRDVLETVKKLARTGKDVLRSEAKQTLEGRNGGGE